MGNMREATMNDSNVLPKTFPIRKIPFAIDEDKRNLSRKGHLNTSKLGVVKNIAADLRTAPFLFLVYCSKSVLTIN